MDGDNSMPSMEEMERIRNYYLKNNYMQTLVDAAGMTASCLESGKLVFVVRCKDCKHRPIKPDCYENGFDLEFPDGKCPCLCADGWYSWFPSDDWFCADGELKD